MVPGMIKAARRGRHLSQEKLAKRLRISDSYLSRIENGKKYPSKKLAGRIAEVLDMNRDMLEGWALIVRMTPAEWKLVEHVHEALRNENHKR